MALLATSFPPYSRLASQINQNYSVAAEYYSQRQNNFKKIVLNNSTNAIQKWENALNKQINNFMTDVRQRAYSVANQVNRGEKPKGAKTKNSKYQIYLDQILQAAKIKTNPDVYGIGKIAPAAGIPFEKFLADNEISDEQINAIAEAHDETEAAGIQECLQGLQQVGAVSQYSALQTGSKEIRSDLAIKTKKGDLGQVELTTIIDIDGLESSKLIQTIDNLVEQGALDFSAYGFQVKTYQGDWTNRHWMGASVAGQSLDAILRNGETWSSNYATLYAEWYLSRMIINIVNPINIGVITGSGLVWMSDFLQHYRFLMAVIALPNSPNTRSESYRGGGIEIFPALQNHEIYIHLINSRNFQRRDFYLKKKENLKDNGVLVDIQHLV